MQIDLCIDDFINEHKLDEFRSDTNLAGKAAVDRETIAKLRHSGANPRLDTLGKVVSALADAAAMPPDVVLFQLLSMRPPEFLKMIPSDGSVRLFLGEHSEHEPGGVSTPYISRRDALVSFQFMRYITARKRGATIQPEYLSSASPDGPVSDASRLPGELIALVRDGAQNDCSIFIGSPRRNPLVEHFVAAMFNCPAYREPRERPIIPFHLVYRPGVRLSSCFGGMGHVPGHPEFSEPGIYLMDGLDHWTACPWQLNMRDAGMVIIQWVPEKFSCRLALWGLSGWGTEALGRAFLIHPDRFWQPDQAFHWKNSRIAVCICHFRTVRDPGKGDSAPIHAGDLTIHHLKSEVLSHFLQCKS